MTKWVGWLVEVLHEDGELPVGVPQLAGHRLPLEDQGADLDEVLVALHALVVPEMSDIFIEAYEACSILIKNLVRKSLYSIEYTNNWG